jgi:DNA-binding NtrC family response regulator
MRLLARENVHIVVSDVKLPDGNGVDLVSRIKQEYPAIEIIVLTAYGTIQDGVKAIKNGAFDYLTKGEHQEKILPLLSKASEKALLQQKIYILESKLQNRFGFENILGACCTGQEGCCNEYNGIATGRDGHRQGSICAGYTL